MNSAGHPTHYQRWFEEDCVGKFAGKDFDDFFRSEKELFAGVARDVRSVLDIGCASGRFLEFLNHYGGCSDYCGIDIVPKNVETARNRYPDAEFHCVNGLEFEPGREFDLVNSTGVCQHEPRYWNLIDRMCGWAKRYVMFDVKLIEADEDIVDIERAWTATAQNRIYFILLSKRRFIPRLARLPGVAHVRIYGYPTTLNDRTFVPDGVGTVYSAGVLIEMGSAIRGEEPRIVVNL